jgi:uncharacterized protein YjbI with pentapeptide repeats/uncharacterized membrane protein
LDCLEFGALRFFATLLAQTLLSAAFNGSGLGVFFDLGLHFLARTGWQREPDGGDQQKDHGPRANLKSLVRHGDRVYFVPLLYDSFTFGCARFAMAWLNLLSIALMVAGLVWSSWWLAFSGCMLALILSLPVIVRAIQQEFLDSLNPAQRRQVVAIVTTLISLVVLAKITGLVEDIGRWAKTIPWDIAGSLAEWTGALGQVLIAILAVYIAWRQYVISRDLTIEQNRLTTQQNVLTQQQTIDTYFQGISDLALDDEGFLEDWPQEQAFAVGRTAALMSSVDANGKAKVLRFLSQSKLLSPLKRDRRLGRPMFDGDGGYAEDRDAGLRVIDLGVILAGADLAHTDLRWTDLSDANMIRANLRGCDLVRANLSRTILYGANLSGADLKGTMFFYGKAATASPRSKNEISNYETGAFTGAVVENADFSGAIEMSEEQRCYCCMWGGEKTRATVPGGCQGIVDRLTESKKTSI